jgi:hypothetical protein
LDFADFELVEDEAHATPNSSDELPMDTAKVAPKQQEEIMTVGETNHGYQNRIETTTPRYHSTTLETDDDISSSSFCGSCCLGRPTVNTANVSGSSTTTTTSSETTSSSGETSDLQSRKKKRSTLIRLIRWIKNSQYSKASFYRNNISFYIAVLVYILVQVALVLVQLHIYSEVNWAVKLARSGGILLDFNASLVIILVLRRLMTWLRNSLIGRDYLPVDHFIKFHKYIGILIFVYSIIHTVGHSINLCKKN